MNPTLSAFFRPCHGRHPWEWQSEWVGCHLPWSKQLLANNQISCVPVHVAKKSFENDPVLCANWQERPPSSCSHAALRMWPQISNFQELHHPTKMLLFNTKTINSMHDFLELSKRFVLNLPQFKWLFPLMKFNSTLWQKSMVQNCIGLSWDKAQTTLGLANFKNYLHVNKKWLENLVAAQFYCRNWLCHACSVPIWNEMEETCLLHGVWQTSTINSNSFLFTTWQTSKHQLGFLLG